VCSVNPVYPTAAPENARAGRASPTLTATWTADTCTYMYLHVLQEISNEIRKRAPS
jgi:hypothetical protein